VTTYWRNADIIAALDGLLDQWDAGAGPAVLRFYDGTLPADVAAALSGNNLLVEVTLPDPVFAGAVNDTPGALATAGAITGAAITAAGTCTFVRALDSNGVVRAQAAYGTSGTEFVGPTATFVVGVVLEVDTLTAFMAESA
jgi:hypothetical protein